MERVVKEFTLIDIITDNVIVTSIKYGHQIEGIE